MIVPACTCEVWFDPVTVGEVEAEVVDCFSVGDDVRRGEVWVLCDVEGELVDFAAAAAAVGTMMVFKGLVESVTLQ